MTCRMHIPTCASLKCTVHFKDRFDPTYYSTVYEDLNDGSTDQAFR